MAGGAGLAVLESLVRATVDAARAARGEAAELAAALDSALNRLVEVTRRIHAEPDADVKLANATLYLEAAGHITVAWVWLEQFLATADRKDALALGKRQAARYFYRYELPRTAPQLDLLARLDRTTLDLDPIWL